jgi:hypothetical protein
MSADVIVDAVVSVSGAVTVVVGGGLAILSARILYSLSISACILNSLGVGPCGEPGCGAEGSWVFGRVEAWRYDIVEWDVAGMFGIEMLVSVRSK